MEDPTFQKTPQSYHGRRVEHRTRIFKNKKDEGPYNHTPNKQHKQSGQFEEGKGAYGVKPSNVPCEQIKNLEIVKKELVINSSTQDSINKEQNKAFIRRKDAKEHKPNFKDGERRKYPPKEKNGRPFKTIFHTARSQNRTKELSPAQVNNETRKKEQYKNESELRKQNVGASRYSKPAVHVQPLQQLPKGVKHPGVKELTNEMNTHDTNKIDFLSKDTSQQPQKISNEKHANPEKILEKESKEERSLKNGKTFNAEQSTMPEERSVKTSPKPDQISLENNDAKIKKENAGSDFPQNTCYNEGPACLVKSNDMKTTQSFNSSAFYLSPRLKSSQSVNEPIIKERLTNSQPLVLQMIEQQSQGPANRVATDASFKISNNNTHYLAGEEKPQLEMSPAKEQMEQKQPKTGSASAVVMDSLHDESQQLTSLESRPSEKYGYRISVDSLFSSSFFQNPQINSNANKDLLDGTRSLFENDESTKRTVISSEAPTVLSDVQTSFTLDETPKYSAVNSSVTPTKDTSFPPHDNTFPSPPLTTRTVDYEQNINYDVRVVSPRSKSKMANESSHLAGHNGRISLANPGNELLHNQSEVESECRSELVTDPPFTSQDIKVDTYKHIPDHVEDTYCNGGVQNNSLTLFPSVKSSKIDTVKGKDSCGLIQPLTENKILSDAEKQQGDLKNRSGVQTSSLTDRQNDEPSINKSQHSLYPCSNTNKTSRYTETQLHCSSSAEVDNKELFEKHSEESVPDEGEEVHVHQPPFSQGPYIPNPFLGHSLLTHRHAIPSAFVYPSRVGIPGGHAGFNDVGQHTGTSPSSHLFPPHGTTVCINVGGRLFEVLPSTFAAYPESRLYQMFSGATTAPINQRGHIFFDRDGYLFEIILAFARVGNLTLPPRLSLPSLVNEATFFGMYKYMFKQGPLPFKNPFHFQRTAHCTLSFDISTNKSETKVFVLEGDDKLKIESLKVIGDYNLYVDLYTPSGVKETSDFLLYDSKKPNLWKAYQFCASRQLVFHLGPTKDENAMDDINPSAEIVFTQTFVFRGDEFIP